MAKRKNKSYKDYFNEMDSWSSTRLRKVAKTGRGQRAIAAQDLLDYEKKGRAISKKKKSKSIFDMTLNDLF